MAAALPFIYLGATVATGALSYTQARNAGKAQEIAYGEQAKQEEMSARDREIERRRNLVRVLATNNAEAGAFGIDAATGSRRAITLENSRLAGLDSLADRAMTSRRGVTLRSQGRAARQQGNLQGAINLADTAGSLARAG